MSELVDRYCETFLGEKKKKKKARKKTNREKSLGRSLFPMYSYSDDDDSEDGDDGGE